MNAKCYSEINASAEAGIQSAARELGTDVNDLRGYYLDGGDWDAETADELAELIVTCWREQRTQSIADARIGPPRDWRDGLVLTSPTNNHEPGDENDRRDVFRDLFCDWVQD